MPNKAGKLTPQERALGVAFAATGDVASAAQRAGYAHRTSAHNALARPEIQAEVARIQRQRLFNEVLPLAVDVHIAVLKDKNTPAGARVQAAKLAYEYAFGEKDQGGKDPAEMTPGELKDEMARLRSLIADKAKLIDATVLEQGDDGAFA